MQAMANTKYKGRQTMTPRKINVTPTSELHELATKRGVHLVFKFVEPPNFVYHTAMKLWSKDEMRGNYVVQLTVGDKVFKGQSDFPQQAKHNAGKKI